MQLGVGLWAFCFSLFLGIGACHGLPSQPHPPNLTGAVVRSTGTSFSIFCDFQPSLWHVRRSERAGNSMRVIFQAGHHDVYEATVPLTSSHVGLPLSVLAANMNQNFACKTQLRKGQGPNTTPLTSVSAPSAPRFFGIRTEPKSLQLTEGGDPQQLHIISTVPVVCDHNLACCISINLRLGGPRFNLGVLSSCSYQLCSSDWNSSRWEAAVAVKVIGSNDGLKDGDQRLAIKFDNLIPAGGGNYHQIFKVVE